MQTLRDIAPYAALAAVALSLALLVLVLVLWSSVRHVRRSQLVVMGHHEQRDIVAHVESLDSQVRNLREAVEILTDQLDEQKRRLDHALTNRAIVRYDAFRDAGGEQSASFALLDDHRSGVVFSAIAARDFARIYIKHLRDGVADRDLSPEEEQAVAAAVPRPLAPGEDGPRAARPPRLADEQRPPGGGRPPGDDERKAFDALADLGDPAAAGPAPAAADVPPPEPATDDEPFTWDAGDGRPGGPGSSSGA
jgi:hypothetical protein